MVQLFEEITSEQRVKIMAGLGTTQIRVDEDVAALKSWAKTQPHLPEIPSEKLILTFLKLSKWSTEKAKKKIDAFYTIWCRLPSLLHLETLNPTSQIQMTFADINYIISLPKLTEDLHRVTVIKFTGQSEEVNHDLAFIWSLNVIVLRILEDVCVGEIRIFDLEFYAFKHFSKVTPSMIKMFVEIYKKVFTLRTEAIHLINCPSTIDSMLKIIRSTSIINPKMMKNVFVHKTLDTLYGHVPKTILPRDYGGYERSLNELNGILKMKMMEHKEYFDRLDTLKVNEDLRPEKLINDDFLGFYGTFKHLDID
ncbi:alpha-tocopherol transfer protein-like [Tenebrio molitor]|uniref:alpha-tocopherol transfer protein-like n=1 Tax=Tenebrio molitor TaxID=7067 RepID=UPI0036247955